MIDIKKRWLSDCTDGLSLAGLFPPLPRRLKTNLLQGKILSPLSASTSKKGDRFTLQVISPERFQKAMIEGEVAKAKAAGRVTGKSELLFSFKKLVLADGKEMPIVADLTESRIRKA